MQLIAWLQKYPDRHLPGRNGTIRYIAGYLCQCQRFIINGNTFNHAVIGGLSIVHYNNRLLLR